MENSLNLKSRVKVVALDFDGVITNLDVNWNSAIKSASEIAGYNVKSLLTFYKATHGTSIFQEVSKEMEKLELEALKNAELTPYIAEFLEKISKSPVEMYVVSMQSAMVVEKFLRQHDLTRHFKEMLTRERFPCKKAQVAHILEESGASPTEILLVDDSQKNIDECKQLGIKCFHFIKRQDASKTKQIWDSVIDLVQSHIR
jgi:HAD superfamily hydrolase (TIGR01509 family)